MALTRSEMERNGVSLRTRLLSELSPVAGDRIQLQQLILNLLVNAIDAMKEVDERPRELLVWSQKHGMDSVLIAVHDSGTGLGSESLSRVFDAFYTTKLDGMGMGLAISRSIIEAHGGRLWATHNVPNGAIFQFTLPAAEGSHADPRQAGVGGLKSKHRCCVGA
jgi:signal transduction histidine kinase